MGGNLLIGIAGIIVMGIAAQWVSWRMRLPAILLFLACGFAVGPLTGFIDPDELMGNLLSPFVSLSVAIILFEGGLNLRIAELKAVGSTVRNLLTIGAIITWFVAAAAAYTFTPLGFQMSVLLGALLIVSGPTVIVPLLRHVQPSGRVASILRWEGTLVDPIGAMLAVLIFELLISGGKEHGTALAALGFFKTIVIGGGIGFIGARIMMFALKRFWIPDFLQNPFSLTMVVAVFAISNAFQTESGLLAVTVMGIVLANQSSVNIHHIMEFKENLQVILISSLFIVLAARLRIGDMKSLSAGCLLFLAILMLVGRPLAVAVSTIRSGLSTRERIFLAAVAPRGIVAAAVASVLAMRLVEAGRTDAEALVPLTFLVIVGTVVIYGLSASSIAKWLAVAKPNPQGVLIVGAHSMARAMASALVAQNFDVLLIDTNWSNITAARMQGIPAHYGSILSEYAMNELDLEGIGRLLALTSNDEVNTLAAINFARTFGRAEAYQLATKSGAVSQRLHGRLLFGEGFDYAKLEQQFEAGAVIKTVKLSEEYDLAAFKKAYGESAVVMFAVLESGELLINTTDKPPALKPGQTIVALVESKPQT